MNIDTKDFVHPCFTDVVKQMSPVDAILLQQPWHYQRLLSLEHLRRNQTFFAELQEKFLDSLSDRLGRICRSCCTTSHKTSTPWSFDHPDR